MRALLGNKTHNYEWDHKNIFSALKFLLIFFAVSCFLLLFTLIKLPFGGLNERINHSAADDSTRGDLWATHRAARLVLLFCFCWTIRPLIFYIFVIASMSYQNTQTNNVLVRPALNMDTNQPQHHDHWRVKWIAMTHSRHWVDILDSKWTLCPWSWC